MPVRIQRFDQVNFLASPPALDFFLATDRRIGIDEAFVIDQAREVVAAGETRDELVLMLERATAKATSDPG